MTTDIPTLNLMEKSTVPFRIDTIVFQNHYNPDNLHRHNYHEIFFFEKGGGTHYLDFDKIIIEDFSIHLLLPGQAHQLARTPRSNGYVLMFEPEFFHLSSENTDFINSVTYLYNGSEHTHASIGREKYNEFKTLLETIEKEYNSSEKFRAQLLQSYLNIVVLKVKQALNTNDFHSQNNLLEFKLMIDFKQLIEKEFNYNRSVANFCDQLQVSYKLLNKISKNHTGKNPAELIAERLLMEAKRLLLHTRLSIKEIAYKLNYDDPSHFSKFIKNTSGKSPAELREELVKIYQ